MELWQLEVFTAVAKEKSFSRAGHRIGRTQPANAKEIAFITEPPESGVEVSSPTPTQRFKPAITIHA